jgi:hypothetical protein
LEFLGRAHERQSSALPSANFSDERLDVVEGAKFGEMREADKKLTAMDARIAKFTS